MISIKKKDEVQQKAISAWLNSDKHGTCEIITGLGKTFVGLHALYTMPRDKNVVHYFLAEVVDRQRDLLAQIKIYNKIFHRDVLEDYNLQFECYQTVYKWKGRRIGLVIADEIHDSLTPAYSQFYKNNDFSAIIGLSALIDVETYYEEENKTKGYYLSKVAPICYQYHLNQGLEEGTARNLDIYIINHKLDDSVKSIKAGSARKPFMQTEAKAYTYWDKVFKDNIGAEINYNKKEGEDHKTYLKRIDKLENQKSIKITSAAGRRSKILYDLPSKIEVTKQIIRKLTGKVIIFGNSIDSLLQVTKNTVSSRNSEAKNSQIRTAFDNNDIRVIGSFKKLKQGANLKDLDACILMSYYSKQKDLIQRLGRLRENGQIGKVFIIMTEDTQEKVWVNKMFEQVQNYNFIYCSDIQDCINKLT